ncbi:helix-turn-helix transcriptional regulator [Candidatus Nephthysia bennettiae]|uniref:Helix-turn-helix transcriptional regulator n=1 Tax=Candidatus Nephthysia bennettiae TaxID=3127016 RepID=A0A934N9C7_9BACT|nr:helix-turn-helix transcriptional regulator [Candidatus Dormibacteraeota bacterium]MBJ7614383.1 helix-turn-helix transcriptional regulator [Candidatus Dormibacteraeota bacterium]
MSPDGGVGERIRAYRRRRGLSQAALAHLVGRSESWLSQVERSILPVENLGVLVKLAEVLKVDVRVLTGLPFYLAPDGGVQLTEVEAIRSALSSYSEIEALLNPSRFDVAPASLSDLRKEVYVAWQLRQASRYQELGRKLPGLLTVTEAATRYYEGDDLLETRGLLSEVYQVTRAMLRKMGETEYAWIAGDRAIQAARLAGRPLDVAAGARALGLVFLAEGRLRQAETVVMRGVNGLETYVASGNPEYWSVWGALLLVAALIAARKGSTSAAAEYIEEASRAAHYLGRDRNDLRTAFGPTNVAIHRVSVAVELGDPGRALREGDNVNVERLPAEFRERRSTLLVEVARARAQQGDRGTAILHLLEAEAIAPEEVRFNFIVREMLRDFLKKERKLRTPGLWSFAQRLGVLS